MFKKEQYCSLDKKTKKNYVSLEQKLSVSFQIAIYCYTCQSPFPQDEWRSTKDIKNFSSNSAKHRKCDHIADLKGSSGKYVMMAERFHFI